MTSPGSCTRNAARPVDTWSTVQPWLSSPSVRALATSASSSTSKTFMRPPLVNI